MNKSKSVLCKLFKLNNSFVVNITRVMYNKLNKNIYISSIIMYKQKGISLNKKNKQLYKKDNSKNLKIEKLISYKNDENKLRLEMEKDKNITIKRMSELTKIPEHKIRTRFYMKLRREINGKVLK